MALEVKRGVRHDVGDLAAQIRDVGGDVTYAVDVNRPTI